MRDATLSDPGRGSEYLLMGDPHLVRDAFENGRRHRLPAGHAASDSGAVSSVKAFSTVPNPGPPQASRAPLLVISATIQRVGACYIRDNIA